MKKTKKLNLKSEALRALTPDEAEQASGGLAYFTATPTLMADRGGMFMLRVGPKPLPGTIPGGYFSIKTLL